MGFNLKKVLRLKFYVIMCLDVTGYFKNEPASHQLRRNFDSSLGDNES
jgi:hypothetical protein